MAFVHNICASFRPILSAIRTPIYEIAKVLAHIARPLTNSLLKDSSPFTKEIV